MSKMIYTLFYSYKNKTDSFGIVGSYEDEEYVKLLRDILDKYGDSNKNYQVRPNNLFLSRGE